MMTTEPLITHKLYNVYAVRDNLTNKFMQPVFVETEIEVKRWFEYVLNDNKLWKNNAGCYDLWKIGMFEENVGFTDTEKELVITGTSIRKED